MGRFFTGGSRNDSLTKSNSRYLSFPVYGGHISLVAAPAYAGPFGFDGSVELPYLTRRHMDFCLVQLEFCHSASVSAAVIGLLLHDNLASGRFVASLGGDGGLTLLEGGYLTGRHIDSGNVWDFSSFHTCHIGRRTGPGNDFSVSIKRIYGSKKVKGFSNGHFHMGLIQFDGIDGVQQLVNFLLRTGR